MVNPLLNIKKNIFKLGIPGLRVLTGQTVGNLEINTGPSCVFETKIAEFVLLYYRNLVPQRMPHYGYESILVNKRYGEGGSIWGFMVNSPRVFAMDKLVVVTANVCASILFIIHCMYTKPVNYIDLDYTYAHCPCYSLYFQSHA